MIGKVFQDLACRIHRHDLIAISVLSEQAALVECSHCHKQWAMKMAGGNEGSMIPWAEAKLFYTDERIKRVQVGLTNLAPLAKAS